MESPGQEMVMVRTEEALWALTEPLLQGSQSTYSFTCTVVA